MSESYSPIGDPVVMATVLAAGGFPPDSRPFGVLTALNTGPGIYLLTLPAGGGISRANASVHANLRGLAVAPLAADKPNVRHLTGTSVEVRTFVAGALANRDFDIEITRRAIGAV